ncbi:unnamed protein product [Ophioblennius macclurei]
MTTYSNGGIFNPAYHDSETLEIDRRFPARSHHANPYAGADPTRRGDGDALGRAPQGESWRRAGGFPMSDMSSQRGAPSWQHELDHSTFQIEPESRFSRSPTTRLPLSGNTTMRWRGATMRRMSLFPSTDPAHAAFAENAIRNEMENEEQNLVKELVALSTQDRIRAIRDLPVCCQEKKHIRSQVLASRSFKKSQQLSCFADCSENASLTFRRCGYNVASARQTFQLWQGTLKEIGGKFGSGVLTYFLFLKWLLMFNVFSFLVNFGFITIPLLVHGPSPSNVTFSGLEILTGAGHFAHTVLYYGSYSNQTLHGALEYNMQLSYFFTIAVYMVLCKVALIYSMAKSFQDNYVPADSSSGSAWQLLCSWDFSVTNERAVRQRKCNLRIQLKESLSESAQSERLTVSERLKHFGVHLGSWILSTGLAVGCGAAIYFLCEFETKREVDFTNTSLLREAETLLVPFVVSLVNLVIPLFYSLFIKFERYSSQRRQIYVMVGRNVLLRMIILAVLCYYWMDTVAEKFTCWESRVGQALYRLVLVDFFFLMLGSFFGEFLSNVIGTKLLLNLGVPEFDVARNVLDLIYSQTLSWIGLYFSPLLPAMQIIKFFVLFYIKKVSIIQNCQPPRRSARAAQMQTIFIFLLFCPFFVGALSMVAYTAWSLTPSEECGPFRGLNTSFTVVERWMEGVETLSGSQWVVWIYQHIILSQIFYFLITLIILVIIYIFWQVSRGRRELISLLRQQIVNEGKDKSFLLDKLQSLQRTRQRNARQKKQRGRSVEHPSGGQSNSNAMVQALIARQQDEEEEERRSDALMQAMLARQREEAYRRPDEHASSFGAFTRSSNGRETDEYYSAAVFSERSVAASGVFSQDDDAADGLPSTVSAVMMQVMQARQRAEEEESGRRRLSARPRNPPPSGSSALIQAMLARQRAQNEYDDGY